MGPTLLAIILAATGRDASELVEQALDRARAAKWPTGLAFAHYAAGLATSTPTRWPSLEEFNRMVAIAVEVGNRRAEALGRTLVIHHQSALLPRAELAVALSRLLRHLQQSGDTTTALLTLSQVIMLLNDAGRPRTAALICGWLDGRSGRNVQSIGDHEAAVAAVQQSLGDQWDLLFQQGRSMTSTQVFDLACRGARHDRLSRPANRPSGMATHPR